MVQQRFFLKINQIDQTCVFQLNWGQGQSLQEKIPISETLHHLYQNWQKLYSQFYSNLRGRVENSGVGTIPPADWRVKLAQAEVLFLNEFYFWLSHAALLPIRSTIAQAAQASGNQSIDLFISCDTIELERLPWESWELGKEFAATQSIQVSRSPVNIRNPIMRVDRYGKTRILAILGDETGLSFQGEIDTLKMLDRKKVAEVKFVGWQKEAEQTDLKQEICSALQDPNGWDILFFAGHSNETVLSHGELQISPRQSMLLKELIPSLKIAQRQGLQVAIFNSCSGLSIAEGLIGLGLQQVVIMREPIHNQVAQEFFLQLVQRLGRYENIHTAIRSACQYLRLEKSITFPSTYLVPSLYRHPDAELFQARPVNFTAKLKQWIPTRIEAIGLLGLMATTSSLTFQQQLIHQRQWVQSVYRDLTGQVEKKSKPPVLLVQIDNQSIAEDKITPIKPINKAYLGRLLDQARTLKAPIVGIDYLLDRHNPETDLIFSQKANQIVKQGTQLFLATSYGSDGKWQQPSESLIDSQSAPRLNMELRRWPGMAAIHAALEYPGQEFLPFSHQLALAQFKLTNNSSQPGLPPPRAHPITSLSYLFGQMWLHPVIDYSIPSEQVYQKISASQFLRSPSYVDFFKDLSQQVLIIAPGLYDEAGAKTDGEEHYVVPESLRYWNPNQQKMSGGEIHAYLIHHWLRQAFIIPIPDLWMILLTAGLMKGGLIHCPRWYVRRINLGALGAVGMIGGVLSLQCYLTFQVLIPWLSPALTIGFYGLTPILKEKWNENKK